MGSCATDKSDMPGRGVNLEIPDKECVPETVELKKQIKLLTDDNSLMRVKLSNLESRYKQETDLTAAYRKVIKDLAEGI